MKSARTAAKAKLCDEAEKPSSSRANSMVWPISTPG